MDLKSAEVVYLLSCKASMNVFARASNQHVNIDKSKQLPVGVPALAPLPDIIVGMPVTHSATTLGITFHAGIGPATSKME
jgi:hypothetical protein